MPRRKKLDFEEEEIDPYYYNGGGSLEYGMDDYDDLTDHMSDAELKALAQYIDAINSGRTGGEEDDDEEEEDEEDYGEADPSYIPPADPLYPGDFDDNEE